MITVNMIKQADKLCGYDINGHAEYAEPGEDIICAAISVLAINTANSIEKLPAFPACDRE